MILVRRPILDKGIVKGPRVFLLSEKPAELKSISLSTALCREPNPGLSNIPLKAAGCSIAPLVGAALRAPQSQKA